ncbi:hypothetical protein NW801_13890 [Brevibacillus laterosporus]|uniref:Uncharacterized protein n=1 Tax=Brevibacillus halotolerans TaxID=1507437 RepID=A0ABT4HYJ0_9BACL|nr:MULTISPECIES: hypothetical protein [Brevibacillus]MCR8986116.1 hypothetical protein [Brevibacillus laterosporus]MCZ0831849.1 hypothetical protein [Brevibacillus halotolerans]GIO03042.1 hypothetical protein J5TS2_37100 [Brevibacillus halotolerans]
MENKGYKIFVKSTYYPIDSSSFLEYTVRDKNKYVISSYDLTKRNSYLSLLNSASRAGLKQLLLTSATYTFLIEKLIQNNFKVHKVEFEGQSSEEEFETLCILIADLGIQKCNTEIQKKLKEIQDMILYLDEKLNSYPKKLTFYKRGNTYSLYNNGVLFIEDEEQLDLLDELISPTIAG